MQRLLTILHTLQRQRRQYLYFTLIEVLVVIGIIAVIAALVIPNLLEGKCLSLFRKLIGLLNTIRADINGATSIGPASESSFRAITDRMKEAVDIVRELKEAGCIDKGKKREVNQKIREIVDLLNQVRSSQEAPVQAMIDNILERLAEIRYPDSETQD